MAFEELVRRISPVLKRITYKLNGYSTLFNHEDLYQEALIHLWEDFTSGQLKDKTDSYILQGCYFHLKNYLRKAREKATLVNLDDLTANQKEPQAPPEDLDTPMIIDGILNNGLTKREKAVFRFCLEGLTLREIGRRIGVSHVMALKIRGQMREKILRDHPLY